MTRLQAKNRRLNDKTGDASSLDTSPVHFGHCISCRSVVFSFQARRAGPTPKGGTPMSALEVIALLTLVIAAVSLGYQIKK